MEGWAERVSELESEMSRCQVAHSVMLQDVANKDGRITVYGFNFDFDPASGCKTIFVLTVFKICVLPVPHRSPAGHESLGFRRGGRG